MEAVHARGLGAGDDADRRLAVRIREEEAASLGEIGLRDVVRDGDERAVRAFYERAVVMRDRPKIEAWTRTGVLARITGPSRFFR